MATITLRAYLEELNALLEQEALEEVIGHCRHILQFFPKNLEAYRLLGKALLEKSRFDEAAEIFPRLLSADPSDFVAHVGLSSIYEQQNEVSRALWHMERAFEQMPNNPAIGDEIRRLYERLGEAPPDKIKMTRGALAKQYANNQMFDQAISELRDALDEQPQRIDLKVLLAQTLWQASYPVEAGEVALEILQVLPDCLDANKLMANLWVEMHRPEDAAPFLKRVEALAPYESLRLIYKVNKRSEAVPDRAFSLDRLDWSAAAARAVAGGDAPDWVSKISDVFEVADDVALTGTGSLEDVEEPGFDATDVPAWITGTAPTPTEERAPSDDLPDWFSAGADFSSKPQTGKLSAPEDWFSEMSTQVSQTGKLTPPPELEQQEVEAAETTEPHADTEESEDEMEALRAAARPPSEEELAAWFSDTQDDSGTDWTASQEPDWGAMETFDVGDEDVPDWFLDESVTAEDEAAPSVTDFAMPADDEAEFAALFDDADEPMETAWLSEEAEQSATDVDFDDLFGDEELSGVETGALGSDDIESVPGDEGEPVDVSTGDLSDDDLIGLFEEDEPVKDTGWLGKSPVSDQAGEASDDDLAGLFEEDEPVIDTGWLGQSPASDQAGEASDDDLVGLFEEDEPIKDTGWLGQSPASDQAGEASDDDLVGLFEEDEPVRDTGWLGKPSLDDDLSEIEAGEKELDVRDFAVETEAPAGDDLADLFEDGSDLGVDTEWLAEDVSQERADVDDMADDELADLFAEPDAGADTSWLGTGDLADEASVEDEFADLLGEEDLPTAATTSADDELEGLFEGDEALAGVDTAWLEEEVSPDSDIVPDEEMPELLGESEGNADWFSAEVLQDVGASTPEAGGDEFTEAFAEDELEGLFEGDEELAGVDTAWLEEETQPEAAGADMADDELAGLFEDADVGADTSWLATAELEAADEGEPETGDEELAALFDESEPADDGFESLFGDEDELGGVATAWLQDEEQPEVADEFTEIFGDDEGQPEVVAEDMADDELAGLFEDADVGADTSWLATTELETADEGEPEAADEEFAALFDEAEPATAEPGTDEIDNLFAQEEEITDVDAELLADEVELETTASDDWLGGVGEDMDLTPEAVDEVDSILAEQEDITDDDMAAMFGTDEAQVGAMSEADEFAMLFDEEDVSINTDFLQTVDAAENIATDTGEMDILPEWLTAEEAAEVESQPVAEDVPDDDLDAILVEEDEPTMDTSFLVADLDDGAVGVAEQEDFDDDAFGSLFEETEEVADTTFLKVDEAAQHAVESEAEWVAFDADQAVEDAVTDEEETLDLDTLFAAEGGIAEEDIELAEPEFDIETEAEIEVDETIEELADIFGEDEMMPVTTEIADLFSEIEAAEDEAQAEADEIEGLFADIDELPAEAQANELTDLFAPEEDVVAEAEAMDDFAFDIDEADEELEKVAAQDEIVRTDDDELFATIMAGGDTSTVIEDADLSPEIDWVRDFSEEDEFLEEEIDVTDKEVAHPAQPPIDIPEHLVTQVPQFSLEDYPFLFERRQPRWLEHVMVARREEQAVAQADAVATRTVSETDEAAFDVDDLLDDDELFYIEAVDDDADIEDELADLLDLDDTFADDDLLDEFDDDDDIADLLDDEELDWLE